MPYIGISGAERPQCRHRDRIDRSDLPLPPRGGSSRRFHAGPRPAPSHPHARVLALATVLIGILTGAPLGRLFGWRNASRRQGFVTSMLLAAVAMLSHKFASAGIHMDLGSTHAPMLLMMLAQGSLASRRRGPVSLQRLSRGSRPLGYSPRSPGSWMASVLATSDLCDPVLNGGPRGMPQYLLLDSSMQVHPDDRVHMWQFRIARWLRSRRLETT